MNEELQTIAERIGEVRADVKEAAAAVSGLRADVARLQQAAADLRRDVLRMADRWHEDRGRFEEKLEAVQCDLRETRVRGSLVAMLVSAVTAAVVALFKR